MVVFISIFAEVFLQNAMPGAGVSGPAGRRAGAVWHEPRPAPTGPLPLVQGQGGEQVRFSYRNPVLLIWISLDHWSSGSEKIEEIPRGRLKMKY